MGDEQQLPQMGPVFEPQVVFCPAGGWEAAVRCEPLGLLALGRYDSPQDAIRRARQVAAHIEDYVMDIPHWWRADRDPLLPLMAFRWASMSVAAFNTQWQRQDPDEWA
jgi:hypothetical protein